MTTIPKTGRMEEDEAPSKSKEIVTDFDNEKDSDRESSKLGTPRSFMPEIDVSP